MVNHYKGGEMTVEEFAQKVQAGEQASLRRVKMDCEANLANCVTEVKPGRKWTKVNIGKAGKFMIDLQGRIFGVKAYGVPNLRRFYGTLDNPSGACFQGLWG